VATNVYRSTSSGTAYAKVASVTSTSLTDNQVNPRTTYFYVVRAANASGVESAASSEASVTTR
jgi:fibronectin type 3 domain-containing protein